MSDYREKLEQHTQEQEEELEQEPAGSRIGKTLEEAEQEPASSDEGNEPIFEGGPTQKQIDEWKSRFKDGVFMTELGDEVFVWRPITRLEYKNIMKIKNADAMFREEKICETCILWPEDYDFTKMRSGRAGVPSILVDQIMERSGFAAESEPQQL